MEEIVQFIFELIFQLIFEVLADVVWRQMPEPVRVAIKAIFAAAFAALLGFLSTLLLPEPLITSRPLALVHLIAGPLLIAWAMTRVGRYFERREKRRSSLERFTYAWLFASAFTLTRFLLTHG